MTEGVRIDLHVHSRHSPDSPLDLESIANRLAFAGLRGFALTDHNSVAGHVELGQLRSRFPGALFVPGVEVSTREGHLLAYGVAEAPPRHRPVVETVQWVERHGGVSVLAHPFRLAHGAGRRVAETAPVAGIEARNGHNSEISNAKAELVAARRGLSATGGSDAHDLLSIGRAHAVFPERTETIDDVLDALRHGRVAPGGRSSPWPRRLRRGLRTSLLRVARGLRPV